MTAHSKAHENIRSFCIIAGDHSADEPGSRIIRALKKACPGCSVFGIGGNQIAAAGTELLFHSRDTGFMGFYEILINIPFIHTMFKTVKKTIRTRKPDGILLIDYPGFNLKIAKWAHRRKIPVFYYIAPQTWAWKAKRNKQIKKYVNHLFTIFPFEERYFSQFGIKTTFVGHPLANRILSAQYPPLESLNLPVDPTLPIISILPGSRKQELIRHIPILKDAVEILKKKFPTWQFVISKASSIDDSFWQNLCRDFHIPVYTGDVNKLMANSSVIAVCSGTASLQAAIHNKPMVIFYKAAGLTSHLGRRLTKMRFIGMINILAGQPLVPELLQHEFTAERLAREIQAQMLTFSQRTIKRVQIEKQIHQLRVKHGSDKIVELIMQDIRS
ncbi:MAG: lipid-A-disaccharide synthase [Candidatus Neomarinimicrobiota bacterium]|nr:MAG: lipid-A-disaccharide synthase [Candidatus Neomarinimicrobiota bacterium]